MDACDKLNCSIKKDKLMARRSIWRGNIALW